MGKIDLGSNHSNGIEATSKPRKGPVVSYPSFSVNDINLPLTSDDVGTTVQATVTLKVNKAGKEIDEYGDRKKRFRASFSVMSISFQKPDLDTLERREYNRSKR